MKFKRITLFLQNIKLQDDKKYKILEWTFQSYVSLKSIGNFIWKMRLFINNYGNLTGFARFLKNLLKTFWSSTAKL